MAGSVTLTGMREAREGAKKLPAAVTAALRDLSKRTAERIHSGARSRVAVKSGYTRDHITLYDQSDQKQYVVSAGTEHPRRRISWHTNKRTGRSHTQSVSLNMLPEWLEYGTKNMTARPFLRPAVEAERDSHAAEMRETVEQAATEALR